MAASGAEEYQLQDPPSDGISSVAFSHASGSHLLVAASWDATLRVYDAKANEPRGTLAHRGAALDASFWVDDAKVVGGGLDKSLRLYDLAAGPNASPVVLGSHKEAIRCVNCAVAQSAVYSGSWDGTIGRWDPRSGSGPTQTVDMPGSAKVYSLSVGPNLLLAAGSGRCLVAYDHRDLTKAVMSRESSLKFQTRCARLMPNEKGFTLSSVEGRVAVEYLDEQQGSKYAFKCHRQGETIYPVNTMSFHPVHGTFATGGCDGTVNVWDGQNKKRLVQYTGYPTSISSLAFSADGSLLAIASSYTFEEGDKDHPSDTIYVRRVNDDAVKPKQRNPP
jgi:cell cycle arrest protein BUB3